MGELLYEFLPMFSISSIILICTFYRNCTRSAKDEHHHALKLLATQCGLGFLSKHGTHMQMKNDRGGVYSLSSDRHALMTLHALLFLSSPKKREGKQVLVCITKMTFNIPC
jgi:hypothetical protein